MCYFTGNQGFNRTFCEKNINIQLLEDLIGTTLIFNKRMMPLQKRYRDVELFSVN